MPANRNSHPGGAANPNLLQMKQHLHRPECIATAVHPFVKQMALSQAAHPEPGHPLRDLPRVMLVGFGVMSSVGMLSLVKPLEVIFGRPSGLPWRSRQNSPNPQIPGQTLASLAPLTPEKTILDTHPDNSK